MRAKYTMSLEPSPTAAQGGWSVCRWLSVLVVAAAVPLLRTTPSDAAPRPDASVSERAVHSRGSGVVDKVLVSFGGHVSEGQIIAKLDSSELDHDIDSLKFRIALVDEELESGLRMAAHGNFSKAAERGQFLVQKRSLENDLKYLLTKRAAFEIRSPAAGRLITRDPSKYVGQRTEPGDVMFQVEPETVSAGPVI